MSPRPTCTPPAWCAPIARAMLAFPMHAPLLLVFPMRARCWGALCTPHAGALLWPLSPSFLVLSRSSGRQTSCTLCSSLTALLLGLVIPEERWMSGSFGLHATVCRAMVPSSLLLAGCFLNRSMEERCGIVAGDKKRYGDAQEELDMKPGHSFLDVGSGCGIIAACAAYLVGLSPSGPAPVHWLHRVFIPGHSSSRIAETASRAQGSHC